MSQILFKSKINSQLRKERKWHIAGFIILIFAIYSIISMLPIMRPPINPFSNPTPIFFTPLTLEYLHVYLISSSIPLLIAWFVMQYFGSFLIIYTDGVGYVKPYRLKMQKFVSWNSIKEIKMFFNDEIRGDRYHYYGAIYIFLKDSNNSLRISGLWVDNIQEAYNLMSKYIKPIQKPEFCKNHPQINSQIQCRTCGGYFCEECVEIKEFYIWDSFQGSGRVYQKCLNCNFKVGIKRMAIIYLIASIIPTIAMFLLFFNLFFDLENYLYGEVHSYWYMAANIQISFSGNIIGIFTTIYAIISVFLILPTPYAYTWNTVNLIKARKMERLKVKYGKKTLSFLTILAILITLYYSIWFYQLHVAWFGGYLIFLSIFTFFSFLYEYWGIVISD